MAQLTELQKDELSAELMRYLSREWVECNLNKAQLRAGINIFDVGMETAESSILAAVPTDVRTWLLAHVTISRWILEQVAQKRREVL